VIQGDPPLRAALDSVFAAPKYDWVRRSDLLAWVAGIFRRILDRFAALETSNPVLFWILVWLLVALLVGVLVHAGYLLVRAARYASAPEAREVPVTAVRRDAAWYRSAAQRAAAAGHYPEAVRAWFDGVVLELDERGALRWHPSKTPREYAREAKLAGDDRARLAGLVDGVYAFSYAGVPCGQDEWEAWRAAAAGGWRVD
jgi:hypothetical protein